MYRARVVAPVLAALMAAGCVSVRVGTDDPSQIRLAGLATGYATLSALPDYDGTLLKAGTLGHADRDGEIVAVDLWPIAGVGVGLVGLRLRLLALETAVGSLFYHPELAREREGDSRAAGDDGDGARAGGDEDPAP